MAEKKEKGYLSLLNMISETLKGLSWKSLRDIQNQSIQTKIVIALSTVMILGHFTGVIGILSLVFYSESSMLLSIGLIGASMVTALITTLYMKRFIAKTTIGPIRSLMESSDRIAAGDFTIELVKVYNDEIGDLTDKYNALLTTIREMMGMLSGEQAAAYLAAEENAEAKEYVDRKVREILEVMDVFAEGDLTVNLDIENDDEIGMLYQGFNKVVEKLNKTLETVRQSANQVRSSGLMIKDATTQLQKDSTAQAANTAEIMQKMEFQAMTAQSISITSEQTRDIVQAGIDITNKAQAKVGNTVEIMLEIAANAKESAKLITGLSESSEKIGEIVLLIKEIANQTNLLALNAAIEAARAGSHGRGFAVVADEVKKLAERTAVSTGEISERIAAIQLQTAEVTSSIEEGLKRIQNGTEIASEAQQSLDQVVESTELGVQMVMQIDSSSEMQSESSTEIVDTVTAIVSSIKSSEAKVSEITTAALDMDNLTEALESAVGQFTIRNYEEVDEGKDLPLNEQLDSVPVDMTEL